MRFTISCTHEIQLTLSMHTCAWLKPCLAGVTLGCTLRIEPSVVADEKEMDVEFAGVDYDWGSYGLEGGFVFGDVHLGLVPLRPGNCYI